MSSTPARDVGGASLLDEMCDFMRRYVLVSSHEAHAVGLWVAHTHAIDAAEATPYLSVTSAEKESGKTRLLEVLSLLVKEPLSTANMSDAALFRAVTELKPTLLYDEIDVVFGAKARDREDLRGMLNAGYRRGAKVYRMGGPKMATLETFEVFCPKVLAGLGQLPDTLQSRCIAIRLKRKAPGEDVARFRERDAAAEGSNLHLRLANWAEGAIEKLRVARPSLPEELGDRQADVWEPLLAIADQAGGQWPSRARNAALNLSLGRDIHEDSLGIQLLKDCRSAFERGDTNRLPTVQLITELAQDDEAPWADWHSNGKPIGARDLARLLKQFEIRSRTIRLANGGTPKGFHRDQFEDAWQRYATEETASCRHTATTGAEAQESDGSPAREPLTEPPRVTAFKPPPGVIDPTDTPTSSLRADVGAGENGKTASPDEAPRLGSPEWLQMVLEQTDS